MLPSILYTAAKVEVVTANGLWLMITGHPTQKYVAVA